MRLIALLSVAVLLLLLVPLFRIAIYTAPWYDDYNYGRYVQTALNEERGLLSALNGALTCARTEWWAWQGTFSSTFFMSLMPGVWGEEYYFLGPVFLILLLLFSLCVFVKVLVRDVLRAERAFCAAMQAIVSAMVIELMFHSQSGLFWYNSGIHYVGMHAFLLLLVSAWIRLLLGAGKTASVFLALWTLAGAVLAGGANYVTALQGLLIGIGLLVLGILLHNKRCFLLMPSLALYAYGFFKNVTAPGNAKRGASYVGWGYSPLAAVGESFLEAFRQMGEMCRLIMPALMILLAPIIWSALKKVRFRFRFPGLVLAGSLCLYATGFTPSLYTLGHGGLARTLNAVKITLQLLLIIDEVYCLGWLQGKLARAGKLKSGEQAGSAPVLFYLAALGLMLTAFAADPSRLTHYTSWGAYHYVHAGEAYNFHQEYLERVETIKNGGSVVTVKPYGYRPWMISPGDLSENPENETNKSMAAWYGKEAVICQP